MSRNASTVSVPANQKNENRGPVVLGVTAWLWGVSTLFVILRCVSRLGIVRRWSWDDTWIVIATVLGFGFSFSIIWGTVEGLGRHESEIPTHDAVPLRKSEYAFSVLYNPVLMATKTSILVFYITLAKQQHDMFKYATYATLGVVNVAGVVLTILNVVQCRPVNAFFQPTTPPGAQCTDLVTLYLASAPVNIITDLAILVLPFPVLTRMRLPKKQKIILVITFSFGAFVAAVDVVRIYYLQQAFNILQKPSSSGGNGSKSVVSEEDFSWYASLSFMWSAIEVHVGIICACVPSLKPLVARVIPSMLRDMSNPLDKSGPAPDSGRNASLPNSPLSNSRNIASPLSPSTPMDALGPNSQSSYPFNSGTPQDSQARPWEDDGPLEEALGSSAAAAGGGASRTPPTTLTLNTGRRGSNSGASKNTSTDDDDDDDDMDFEEFLSRTHEEAETPGSRRAGTLGTIGTNTTSGTRRGSVPFFDFYQMEQKRPMTRLSNRQSYGPIAAVTALFFIWGFAYGLLDVLNSQFGNVIKLSLGQKVGLHSAYYVAYFIAPLTVGRVCLIKLGFKATFITGLCIYAVGTLIFWPSAVLASYAAFVVCNFIVGFGIAILETAANPFIALCGPPQYSEVRLNISQGLQAIGTVVSPLLAEKVLFVHVTDGGSLINVQWTYLGISFFDVLLAIAFFYMPLPEATNEDFERIAEKQHSTNTARILGGRVEVRKFSLAVACFAMFMYVGTQEAVSFNYQAYSDQVFPQPNDKRMQHLRSNDAQTIGHTTFAAGRFITAGAGLLIKPRYVLMILVVGMIITVALMMGQRGRSAVAMICLYEFFQGGVFSLIYAMGLRGLGSHTKTGAVVLTAAISGGAIVPVIYYALIKDGYSYSYSMCVAVAISAACIVYPLYLTIVPRARRQVDPDYSIRTAPADADSAPRRRSSAVRAHQGSTLPVVQEEHHEGGAGGMNGGLTDVEKGKDKEMGPQPPAPAKGKIVGDLKASWLAARRKNKREGGQNNDDEIGATSSAERKELGGSG